MFDDGWRLINDGWWCLTTRDSKRFMIRLRMTIIDASRCLGMASAAPSEQIHLGYHWAFQVPFEDTLRWGMVKNDCQNYGNQLSFPTKMLSLPLKKQTQSFRDGGGGLVVECCGLTNMCEIYPAVVMLLPALAGEFLFYTANARCRNVWKSKQMPAGYDHMHDCVCMHCKYSNNVLQWYSDLALSLFLRTLWQFSHKVRRRSNQPSLAPQRIEFMA